MKKILGSGWLRALLCVGLYIGYFFLVRYLMSGGSRVFEGTDAGLGAGDIIVVILCICGLVAGWRFVRHIDTSAGAFMAVIKFLLAIVSGLFVLPFMVGSIPYRLCRREEAATAEEK